ncbi:MAG: hypothetical protein ACFE96_04045 [Candidatus Hermodarchaeota archaeon]
MSDAKENSFGLLIPNYFYRKKECYCCDSKRHRLFARENHNFIELLCKDCRDKFITE